MEIDLKFREEFRKLAIVPPPDMVTAACRRNQVVS